MMDFSKYLENLQLNLGNLADLESSKEIQYGHSFKYRRGDEKVTLNVYNGKKGIRLVWQGENKLRKELENFVCAMESAQRTTDVRKHGNGIDEHVVLLLNDDGNLEADFTDGIWAGSDESGKGDFFGPLVLGAVALNGKTAMELKLAGVKDCKLLTDKKILELEPVIKEKAIAYSVLQLKPRFYNQRYAEVVAQGGKLNQLLASGHINALKKVLQQLVDRKLSCEYALVDQFTKSDIVMTPLQQAFPKVVFKQQTKAESNLAVAAASILARAQFLHTMDELAQQLGVGELPKGGSALATEFAQNIADKYGKDALGNFVKLHFANFKRIQ